MTKVPNRPDYGAFIPAYLDDYPLNMAEFRIYARILRRAGTKGGKYFESVGSTAQACGMNQKTARAAIRVLEALNMVTISHVAGKPNEIEPTHHDEWVAMEDVEAIRKKIKSGSPPLPNQVGPPLPNQVGHPYRERITTPTVLGSPPLPREDHEGIPSKGIPEGNPTKVYPDKHSGLNTHTLDPERVSESKNENKFSQEQQEQPTPEFGVVNRQNAAARQEAQFSRQVPPWRTGFGRNDWNEAALKGIQDWMTQTFGRQATRADAIAYIAKREYPDHPEYAGMAARVSEVLATQSDQPRKSIYQRLREERLAEAKNAS